MSPATPDGPDRPGASADRRFVVIVNDRAGSVLEEGAEDFAERLEAAFVAAGCRAEVRLVAPRDIDGALTAAIADGAGIPVIAGGDGTINGVLPRLVEARCAVGVLPLGTVNILGRDLGLAGTVEEQVAALCRGKPLAMDVGVLDDRMFHSISGLGFFSLMAREREFARRRFPGSRVLAFVVAFARSFLFTRAIAVEIVLDGTQRQVEADAVLVTVNRFDGPNWQRRELDGGRFEVHVLNAGGLYSRAKAALSVLTGGWRASDNLVSLTADSVVLTRRDKRGGHVTFDGEVERRSGPLVYRLLPRALTVIADRPSQEMPAS